MNTGALFFVFAPGQPAGAYSGLKKALLPHGFGLQRFSAWQQLRSVVVSAPQVGASGVAGLLAAPKGQNCTATRNMRVLLPAAALLALNGSGTDSESVALYHSGADIVLPSNPSTELVLAATLCALRRNTPVGQPLLVHGSQEPAASRWALSDQGWTLLNPQGQAVALTTTERQFLQLIAQDHQQQVTRQQLLVLFQERSPQLQPGDLAGRLTVMVTRLRRKVQQHGNCALPLKAVHGVGYTFAAPLVQFGTGAPGHQG